MLVICWLSWWNLLLYCLVWKMKVDVYMLFYLNEWKSVKCKVCVVCCDCYVVSGLVLMWLLSYVLMCGVLLCVLIVDVGMVVSVCCVCFSVCVKLCNLCVVGWLVVCWCMSVVLMFVLINVSWVLMKLMYSVW